ncbi:MAG TPA: hypothetical protein VN803_09395, partial [Gemmatimonadales bacterium]|nr:hypothetical protein [Gemmatimonadales bacterium]
SDATAREVVSEHRRTAMPPRRGGLELCRHAQQQILAPERRDELHADRQPARGLPDRQADRRLAGDAEWGSEAPDAFEARQDRERVSGWRQELFEKGGWLSGGGRQQQVEVACPPRPERATSAGRSLRDAKPPWPGMPASSGRTRCTDR